MPNYDQIKIEIQVFMKAMEKAEGMVIMGGDLNFKIDSKLYTTLTRWLKNRGQLKEFKQTLEKTPKGGFMEGSTSDREKLFILLNYI